MMEIIKADAYKVVSGYGRGNVHGGSRKAVVYGFEWLGMSYWFSRKGDASKVSAFVKETNWDGSGDLEIIANRNGLDLGKVHF